MDKCFECGEPAQIEHHVIPQLLGGTKTVPLCNLCHGKVHGKDMVRMAKLREEKKMMLLKQGKRVAGKCPIGYKYIGKQRNKYAVIDEDTKPIVEFLFNNYDPTTKEGRSRGLKKRVQEIYGFKTTHETVVKTLRNDFYIGVIKWGDHVNNNGIHETFITKELFYRTGELITKARRGPSKYKRIME